MFSLLIYIVTANIACSDAVRIENVDNNDVFFTNENARSIFNNEVNTPFEGSSFLKQANEDRDACTDFYSFTCNKASHEMLNIYKFEENIKEVFILFISAAKDLLNNKTEHGIKSLTIEQDLYRSCMKLGDEESTDNYNNEDYNSAQVNNEGNQDEDYPLFDEDSKLSFEDYEIFDTMIKPFSRDLQDHSWQEIDKKLALLGFGHAFFNIKVISDPRKSTKNIILLEPPSVKDWNSKKLTDIMSDMFLNYQIQVFNYCDNKYGITSKNQKKYEPDDESPFLKSVETDDENDNEEISVLCEIFKEAHDEEYRDIIYETLLTRRDQRVIDIFNSLLKFMFDTIDVTNVVPTHHRLTIQAWNKMYNEVVTNHNARIDWIRIFKDEFEHLGISVTDNEFIIVKNQPYFILLADLLNREKDETIERAVRVKFIAENLRYLKWTQVQEDNPVDKSSFCFEETKLYGLSELILKSLKEKHKELHVKKAQEILNNIINVLYSNISETKDLSQSEKKFLKSELQSITKNIFENKWNFNIISNFYKGFNVTDNYFIDISNYRKMLKNAELSRLRETSLSMYEYLPFSINDMENPRNRFLLYTIVSLVASESLFTTALTETETLYATYGVNVASFLYSLLNEKMFESDMYYRHDIEWLIPQTTYSPQTVKCFVPEDIVDYGYPLAYQTITDIFSVQIAYEAMKRVPGTASTKNFFSAYTQARCGTKNKRLTNKVLSNFGELSKALDCTDSTTKNYTCKKRLFQK